MTRMTKTQSTLVAMANVGALQLLHPDLQQFFVLTPIGWIPNYVVRSDGRVDGKDGSWWYAETGGCRCPRNRAPSLQRATPVHRPLAKLAPEFRGYTLDPTGVRKLVGTSIPDQTKVVLQVLNKVLTADSPVVMEAELRPLIEEAKASGRLMTQRDSWAIFVEQRRILMSCGALVEVCTDVLGGLHSGVDPKFL